MSSSPKRNSVGVVKVKNTFIEYKSDSQGSLSSPPVQRSRTIACGDLWTDKDDEYDFPPRSQSDRVVIRIPPPSVTEELKRNDVPQSLQPRTPSPSLSSPPSKTGWVIAWIDERSFKDQAKSMKDDLGFSSHNSNVKCFKSTANFLKTFERKFVSGSSYLDRHKMVVVVSPPNFAELVSFFKSIPERSGVTNQGLRAVIVFKASGPPTHGPGSVKDPCPYTTIFAHEWDVVLKVVQQLTVVHTS